MDHDYGIMYIQSSDNHRIMMGWSWIIMVNRVKQLLVMVFFWTYLPISTTFLWVGTSLHLFGGLLYDVGICWDDHSKCFNWLGNVSSSHSWPASWSRTHWSLKRGSPLPKPKMHHISSIPQLPGGWWHSVPSREPTEKYWTSPRHRRG